MKNRIRLCKGIKATILPIEVIMFPYWCTKHMESLMLL